MYYIIVYLFLYLFFCFYSIVILFVFIIFVFFFNSVIFIVIIFYVNICDDGEVRLLSFWSVHTFIYVCTSSCVLFVVAVNC